MCKGRTFTAELRKTNRRKPKPNLNRPWKLKPLVDHGENNKDRTKLSKVHEEILIPKLFTKTTKIKRNSKNLVTEPETPKSAQIQLNLLERANNDEKNNEDKRGRKRERNSHVRGYACTRVSRHVYASWGTHGRVSSRSLRSRYASSPPLRPLCYPPLPSPPSTTAILSPPSLPRLCIVRLTPPTPEPSRLPPLVSASSRLTLVWLDGPEGSGQFMPNYTLITVMARLRYRWCTELSNCHGPRERGLGSSIGRYDAARRGASMPI